MFDENKPPDDLPKSTIVGIEERSVTVQRISELDIDDEAPSQDTEALSQKRHLFTTGWSNFVTHKKLVTVDTLVFLRGENDDMRVGIRH